jgi:hypothetical protein
MSKIKEDPNCKKKGTISNCSNGLEKNNIIKFI